MEAGGVAATNACRGTTVEMKNLKLAINQNNDETGKISGLVKPKNNSMKISRRIPATTSTMSGAPRDTTKVSEIDRYEVRKKRKNIDGH